MADRTRGISLWGALAIGIGGMVGGGIFAVLGVVAEDAGAGTPLAFLVAGLIALLTGYSYTKLSVSYPSRGGTVAFIDRAFGRDQVSGSVNVLLWLGYIVTISLYAVAFANYAATFFVGDDTPNWLLLHSLITAAIVIPGVLNLLSAQSVAKTETIVVAVKLTILGVVTVAGWRFVDYSLMAVDKWPSLGVIAAAGMMVFVAYEGFELIANAGEDVEDPGRTLKWAYHLSIGFVVVLYVLIAMVTVGNLTPDEIAQFSDFALAKAAEPALGQLGFTLVAISAVLATFSAINASLYGSARLSVSIAMEGELPKRLEMHIWKQPIGLFLTGVGSILLANLLDLSAISTIASSGFLIVFAAVNAACYKLAADIGASRAIAGIGVVGCVAALGVLIVMTWQENPTSLLALVVMVAVAIAVDVGYFTRVRLHRGRSRMYL